MGTGLGIRIGIDVGGTFTDAVAIDATSLELIGHVKVPTTHRSPQGVAAGIIEALQRLLSTHNLQASDVRYISHGTTQATNALLEGDVALVGIVGIGGGLEGLRARSQTFIKPIELAPGTYLRSMREFLATSAPSAEDADRAIRALLGQGAGVIVASGLYSVDDSTAEDTVTDAARRANVPAAAAHQISKLYGLRTRTRTAVINASILPRMIETANSVESSVSSAGITSPLMIMRGDGGVMRIDQLRSRPILTLVSGPAAGVAGALMYERVSDAVFLEVGGTSVDISAIRDGRVQVRYAMLGGHRTFLQSLDVRSIGIGGGSMVRVRNGKIDVGPRSAHIAGLDYAVYASSGACANARLIEFRPLPSDPEDYIAVDAAGRRSALTLSCAANIAGFVPDGDWARGDVENARVAFGPLAERFGCTVDEIARAVIDAAVAKTRSTVDELAADYGLDLKRMVLVGGGGGASALVPALAKTLGCEFRIARNAHVISPIGVALALVRDVVERMIPSPTPLDIAQIRAEAEDAAVAAGAARESVEVDVSVDSQRNIVRAAASGATELRARDLRRMEAAEDERRSIAAESMGAAPEVLELAASTPQFSVYTARMQPSGLLRYFGSAKDPVRVIDREGVIRLRVPDARIVPTTIAQAEDELREILEALTSYGDAGKMLPALHLLLRDRIVNLSGMVDPELVVTIASDHLRTMSATEPGIIVAEHRA
ncbi:MAG TPA: hydantoinase/oxoprolinase family protein [Candidatus Baltobacteraceae bacterium]